MRARRAISLKAIRHSNDDLWSFAMLPDAPAVSRSSFPSYSLAACHRGFDNCFLAEGETVDVARSDPPTPRARAAVHAAQRREQERAARRKERSIRRQECQEQQSEEYRLREQQGLSPPTTPENTSEEEDEESDGGGLPREVDTSTPVAKSRTGGRGAGARGRRRGACCRAVSRRGRACRESTGACHKGVWECRRGGWERRSGGDRRRISTHRILKKEEAGLLHLEVSGRSSRRSGFVRLKPIFFVFRVRTVAPTIPPHARKGA
jgi:hypothetical protein